MFPFFRFPFAVCVSPLYAKVASGRDDRQLVFLPPGTSVAGLTPGVLPNLPLGPTAFRAATFPNQPYEERKYT